MGPALRSGTHLKPFIAVFLHLWRDIFRLPGLPKDLGHYNIGLPLSVIDEQNLLSNNVALSSRMSFSLRVDSRLNSLNTTDFQKVPLISLPHAEIVPVGGIAYDIGSNALYISNGLAWLPVTPPIMMSQPRELVAPIAGERGPQGSQGIPGQKGESIVGQRGPQGDQGIPGLRGEW